MTEPTPAWPVPSTTTMSRRLDAVAYAARMRAPRSSVTTPVDERGGEAPWDVDRAHDAQLVGQPEHRSDQDPRPRPRAMPSTTAYRWPTGLMKPVARPRSMSAASEPQCERGLAPVHARGREVDGRTGVRA